MGRRIAMVGGAPESKYLAPYTDNSWEIWATSMCHTGVIPRCNAFFEIHALSPLTQDNTYTMYLAWLRTLPCVYTLEPHPKFPSSVKIDEQRLFRLFKPHFFTSSLAYMMAMALDLNPLPEMVGFWGFDMMGSDEYQAQRPAVHHFADLMDRAGIKLWVPPESEMLVPQPPYGYREMSRQWKKKDAKLKGLQADWEALRAQQTKLRQEEIALGGAVQQMEYDLSLFYEWGPTGGFEVHNPTLVPLAPRVAAKLEIPHEPGRRGDDNSARVGVSGRPGDGNPVSDPTGAKVAGGGPDAA